LRPRRARTLRAALVGAPVDAGMFDTGFGSSRSYQYWYERVTQST
jgi:hypothetical protein